MIDRRLAILASLALAACGHTQGEGSASTPKTKLGPEIDAEVAEKDAKGLVDEVYANIGRGKTDNLIPLLAPPLVVFGPRREDAVMSRETALVALGKVIDPKKTSQVVSSSLSVMPASGGRSAWAVDVVMIDNVPMAITAVVSNADDLWLVDAAAVARTPAKATMKDHLKKDAVVPPGMAATAHTDSRAMAAMEKFQRGIADQRVWFGELGARDHAIVIGPTAGELTRGKKDIAKLWEHRQKTHVREIAVGEMSSSVTPDGEIAWVTAPVTRVADDDELTPLRVFAVYEREGNDWKMTALHESLAVDQPGAGAAFKKFVPPASRADAPPTEVADDDADAKPAKKVAAKAAAKPAKKAVVEDDEEEDAKPAKPVKPVKKDEPKKAAKKPVVEDDEEDTKPAKKVVVKKDEPKKVAKKPVVEDDEEDAPNKPKDEPKKTVKKAGKDDEEQKPKKKKKKKKKKRPAPPPAEDEDDDKPVAKKPAKKTEKTDDEDDKPAKKSPPKKTEKPSDDDEDEVEVIDDDEEDQ